MKLHALLAALVSIAGMSGCIEFERSLNGEGVVVEEPYYGPVIAADPAAEEDVGGLGTDGEVGTDGADADEPDTNTDGTQDEPDTGTDGTQDEPDAGTDGTQDEPDDSEEPGLPPLPDTADQFQTVTGSGLRYVVVEEGTGAAPVAGDVVQAHYTGYLTGTFEVFDSSFDRGQPFQFTLGAGQVIAGWDELFSTMKAGGIRRTWIPPDLAYGEAGSPPTIPPNTEIIFDVEFLAINP